MKDAYTIAMVPALDAGNNLSKRYIGPNGVEVITQTRIDFPGALGLLPPSVSINGNHPIRGDSKIAIVEPVELDKPVEKTDIEKLREAYKSLVRLYQVESIGTLEESVFHIAATAVTGAIRAMKSE